MRTLALPDGGELEGCGRGKRTKITSGGVSYRKKGASFCEIGKRLEKKGEINRSTEKGETRSRGYSCWITSLQEEETKSTWS